MKNNKLLIGEMAKLHKISEQTLRYYDKIDLLKPLYIDSDSGYRYYTSDQFPQLDIIIYLKNLGIPLKEIKEYLDNKNLNSLVSMLEMKSQDINNQIQELMKSRKIIDKATESIRSYLNQYEENKFSIIKINKRNAVYKWANSINIIDLKYDIKDLLKIMKKGSDYLQNVELVMVIDYDYTMKNIFKEKTYKSKPIKNEYVKNRLGEKIYKDIKWKYYAFITEEEINEGIEYNEIPKGDYATIKYNGTHLDVKEHLKQLKEWIYENGFEIIGDILIVNISDISFTNDENEFISEIQVPIKKI